MTIRLFRIILFIFSFLLVISSCKKINEATDLGGDIIPGVDGVHTFDTSLTVETYDTIFDPLKDSIRVGRSNDHILGNISSDPFFGKTNAKIFLELKPAFYNWNFSGIYDPDSLFLDSVVLVLGWNANYGDALQPQTIRVWEMNPFVEFRIDSFYTLRNEYFTHITPQLGSKTIIPDKLKDSVYSFQDTTAGQLRIRLDDDFGRRLLGYDTTEAYRSDSAFKTYFRGFEIAADATGNALMAFGLFNNPKTKLAIYYRFRKNGQDDTTVSYFQFTNASAQHNFIDRFNFSGTPLAAASATAGQDDHVYLINAPGSYTTVKVPGLRTLYNTIINRAELIVEQVYDPLDMTFTPPDAIMLDVYDSTIGEYKYTPYDFRPNDNGTIDPGYGSYGQNGVDGSGNPIRVWKFNVTRYVQNIVNKNVPVHDFRLFTHRNVFERIEIPGTSSFSYLNTIINSRYAFGRVRLGGGKHPTQPMRLRIVHTKI